MEQEKTLDKTISELQLPEKEECRCYCHIKPGDKLDKLLTSTGSICEHCKKLVTQKPDQPEEWEKEFDKLWELESGLPQYAGVDYTKPFKDFIRSLLAQEKKIRQEYE